MYSIVVPPWLMIVCPSTTSVYQEGYLGCVVFLGLGEFFFPRGLFTASVEGDVTCEDAGVG